jgi:hypothetical protein
MVTGYGGTFRAVVTDNIDPLQLLRLGVVVPDVYGESPVWAAALNSSAALPAIGDLVWVSFESGDTDYPIWQADGAAQEGASNSSGYVGQYRGLVVNNDDPMDQKRLEVTVPDVNPSPAWATPSDDVRYGDTPVIGAEVWIDYQSGNPDYPRWVGVI